MRMATAAVVGPGPAPAEADGRRGDSALHCVARPFSKQIVFLIATDQLRPGQALPSVRGLAKTVASLPR
jgi:hypothetical protein